MGIDLEVKGTFFRERRGELLPTASLRFARDTRIVAQFDREATPSLVTPLSNGVKVWNNAVLAFLVSLPPDSKIILYWC
jgi:hypothetical protein